MLRTLGLMSLSLIMPICAMAQSKPDVEILIIPEATPTPPPRVAPLPRNNGNFERSLETPESQAPNAQSLSPSSDNRPPDEPLSQVRGGSFRRVGGEGGAGLLRLRGSRSTTSAFFWDGIPLTSALQGNNHIDLLPGSLVEEITVHPDTLPWWRESGGLSGGVDYTLFTRSSAKGTKASLRTGSFGLWGASGRHTASLGGPTARVAADVARSREDFWATDDNGTLFRTDDDKIVRRRNNDFQRGSAGVAFRWPGCAPEMECQGSLAMGLEERGLPGPVGSTARTRLERGLVLSALRVRHASPETGRETLAETFFRADGAKLSADEGSEKSLLGGGRVRFTTPLTDSVSAGSAATIQHEQAESLGRRRERSQGRRTSGDASLMLAYRQEFSPEISFASLAFAKLGAARSQLRISCSYCPSVDTSPEPRIWMGGISLQAGRGESGIYGRFVREARRPWLFEKLGSAQGAVANPELRPESSLRFEAGVSLPWGNGLCWVGKDKDLILQEVVNPRQIRSRNLASVARGGCSAEAGILLFRHLALGANYDFVRSRFRHPDLAKEKQLPLTPEHEGALSIAGQNLRLTPEVSTSAGGEWRHRGPLFLDGANAIRLQLPDEVNLHWSVSFERNANQKTGIALECKNLLDEKTSKANAGPGRSYAAPHSGYPGFPDPGRRYYATLFSEF